MSAETIGIAVSVATLIVVGAASAAAIVQLRHLRTSNQLSALLGIMNQWNLPEVQSALGEMRNIPEKMNDPEYVKALLMPGSVNRVNYPEFLAFDLWEQIGTYSKHGLIDESILLDIVSAQVSTAWRLSEPAITVIRTRTGPSAMENFEWLAVRAKQWNEKHPDGTYPPGFPRMNDL